MKTMSYNDLTILIGEATNLMADEKVFDTKRAIEIVNEIWSHIGENEKLRKSEEDAQGYAIECRDRLNKKREENKKLKLENEVIKGDDLHLRVKINQLETKLEKAIEALEYYSDEDLFDEIDSGLYARKILKEIK
jgi:predicted nuclease with TOPRIM domain